MKSHAKILQRNIKSECALKRLFHGASFTDQFLQLILFEQLVSSYWQSTAALETVDEKFHAEDKRTMPKIGQLRLFGAMRLNSVASATKTNSSCIVEDIKIDLYTGCRWREMKV